MDITLKSDIDVDLVDHMGNDASIIEAAKVSTVGLESKPEENTGLINYLMKHRHGTPFEHAAIKILVNAPIFVWREWHRHRIGFSYNEESARYKALNPVFYIPDRERPMMKVDGWKPGRPKFTYCESENTYERLCYNLSSSYKIAYEAYLDNLVQGFDPGLARDCLPVGIYSACFVTCNPRSIMAFLSLRKHEDKAVFDTYPLWEIELAAKKLDDIFSKLFPITHSAFEKNGYVGP